MSKQIDINDLIPSEIKEQTRRFLDSQYQGQLSTDALPLVRNRHEGYGLLAEAYVGVNGSIDNIKAAMRDCLKALAGDDSSFQGAAENTFNALLDSAIAITGMTVQTLNVIYKIMEKRQNEPAPLVDMADGKVDPETGDPVEEDEIPDVEE